MNTTLIFVYNSDSDPVSGLFDLGHKILSPSTYQCSLCILTHGPFTEKAAWTAFRKAVGVPLEFLHRDEFERRYALRFDYPVILRKTEKIEVLMPKQEIDALEDLDALIAAIQTRMETP